MLSGTRQRPRRLFIIVFSNYILDLRKLYNKMCIFIRFVQMRNMCSYRVPKI